MTAVSILDALDDTHLLGGAVRSPETFAPWRALFAALFGLPMSDEEAEVFRSCTGLTDAPTAAFAVLWLVIGRRGGKSFAMALIGVYMAVFRDWTPYLSPGEKAVVLLVAADREQAKILRAYVAGILDANRFFKQRVLGQTDEAIELKGQVSIQVATCSFRSVRGRSVCVALLDETAFWRSESTVNPDKEVWRAIRASMAQFGDRSVAIIASSPYARKGLLYDGYRRFHGKADARNLCWQAPTRVMNPTIPEDFVAAEYEEDPVAAAAEYGAQFRSDVESFVSLEVIEAAVDHGVLDRPPLDGLDYCAFVDPSGGSSDSMTMAVAHLEGNAAVVDAVLEVKPPCSPEQVVVDFTAVLRRYGLKRVQGDRYAGMWPRERFAVHGVTYEPAARPKSDLYRDFLPVLNGARVRLVDDPRLVAQIASLERRTARGGKDSIDHPPNGHDDVANCVAGVVAMVIGDGAPDPVPVGEISRYVSSIYGGARSVADRIDRLSPQAALARGLITKDRAEKLGVRPSC